MLRRPFSVIAASVAGALALAAGARGEDFASAVVAYVPAPAQRVNDALYNDPARALGAPVGGGTVSPPDVQKLVTLGGFGGSITLRFAQRVMDDPCNPFGLDAVVFGNAFWVGGNPNRRFVEAGVIEISRDANANGLADDAWYVIPGSHIPSNPPGAVPQSVRETQAWDADPFTSIPPADVSWYPGGAPALFMSTTFALPALFDTQVLTNPLGSGATREGVWGYADNAPTLLLGDLNADNIVENPALAAGEFYTSPDNPFAVGMTPGSGGGDAFDIAWAVDPISGLPPTPRLDGFDFIRVSTGVNFVAGVLGEVSTEVGGVSDVRPRESFFDRTGDARATIDDLYRWHELRQSADALADIDGDGSLTPRDRELMQRCVRSAETGDTTTSP